MRKLHKPLTSYRAHAQDNKEITKLLPFFYSKVLLTFNKENYHKSKNQITYFKHEAKSLNQKNFIFTSTSLQTLRSKSHSATAACFRLTM